MKPEKALERDVAFYAAVEALVAEVRRGERDNPAPNYPALISGRQALAAYVLAELDLGVEDFDGIAVNLARFSGGEEKDPFDTAA